MSCFCCVQFWKSSFLRMLTKPNKLSVVHLYSVGTVYTSKLVILWTISSIFVILFPRFVSSFLFQFDASLGRGSFFPDSSRPPIFSMRRSACLDFNDLRLNSKRSLMRQNRKCKIFSIHRWRFCFFNINNIMAYFCLKYDKCIIIMERFCIDTNEMRSNY